MLVLSRKKGQEIVINDDIIIQVLDVKKDYVKIGVSAPSNFSIHRREVYELIKDINRTSASLDLNDIEKLSEISKEIEKK